MRALRASGSLAYLAAFCLLALSACNGGGVESDGSGQPRWRRIAGAIGATCRVAGDCHEGPSPVCFSERLFNMGAPVLPTPDGYCSSQCTSDEQCGDESRCADFASYGKWCVARCGAASDCRDDGYACVFRIGCFPDGNLTCDPSATGGVCQTADGHAGGCVRSAFGEGNRGYCWEQCETGVATCSAAAGRERQCAVIDATRTASGEPTRDRWKGPVCVYTVAQSNPVGDLCLWDDGTGRRYYPDTCSDGAGCYLQGTAPAGSGYDEAGDNRCHEYCNPQQSSCDRGTCKDIWGLGNVGLCVEE